MADVKTNIADMEYKELTVQQNSNTIYIQREAVNMPVISGTISTES